LGVQKYNILCFTPPKIFDLPQLNLDFIAVESSIDSLAPPFHEKFHSLSIPHPKLCLFSQLISSISQSCDMASSRNYSEKLSFII
jgi:hypothetical protein